MASLILFHESEIDGENGYTLRRRRRDVSERSADSLLESNNTTLSADVGLFKPRRFQKVALEFLLTGEVCFLPEC